VGRFRFGFRRIKALCHSITSIKTDGKDLLNGCSRAGLPFLTTKAEPA
jgi:hypothetical protein